MHKIYIYMLLLNFSVTFSFFLGSGSKNLFMIAVISISPFLLFFLKKKDDKVDKLLKLYLLVVFVIGVINFQSFRLSSYLYTFCLVSSFLYLKQKALLFLDQVILLTFLRYIIYTYFFVLLLQQLCVLIGISPFLVCLYDSDTPFKLSSLSPEPSHLAIYMLFFAYTYVVLTEKMKCRRYTFSDGKSDAFIWFSYFWVMLTCQSTTAMLMCLMIFVRNIKAKTLMKYSTIMIIVIISVSFIFEDSQVFLRAKDILPALFTFSPEEINFVDHSAAHRIVPLFAFFEWINPFSLEFWIGGGMDTGLQYCRDTMFLISGDGAYSNDFDEAVNLGGIFCVIMDYGFIAFSILFAALFNIFRQNDDKLFVWIWCFVSLFTGLNTQIIWLGVILFFLVSRCHQR